MENEINVAQTVAAAIEFANKEVANTEYTEHQEKSNGSEAWQVAKLEVKGMRKVQNQLKKIEDVRHDSYHGYLIGAPFSNFYKENTWTSAVAGHLTRNGIPAHRAERLL